MLLVGEYGNYSAAVIEADALLLQLGAVLREHRRARQWSRRELSRRSGLSERFLADLEAGRGNISVLRLLELGKALGVRPDALLGAAVAAAAARFPTVALLGLRGAGKSAVGRRLAERWGCPFVELDERIETVTGLSLDQIFQFHGEAYYRNAERVALAEVLAAEELQVLACGGGIVNSEEVFRDLLSRAHTVWLEARAEDHWERVVAQGDTRPMANNEQAFQDLCAILRERESLYSRAELTVDTTGRSLDDLVDELTSRLPADLTPVV